jgi:hypothetical protein
MANPPHQTQAATQDIRWIDALIDAAQSFGGPEGVDLDTPMRTPDRWLPDLYGPEFDYLDGDEDP